MKRFQNLSRDQVNFMVKIKILRPPTGSCNFVAFEKLLVLINTVPKCTLYHVVTSTNIKSIMLTSTYSI